MVNAEAMEEVRGLLKAELAHRKVGYAELARLLTDLGLPLSAAEVTQRIEHGEISGAFFTQCCEAIGAPVIHLDF